MPRDVIEVTIRDLSHFTKSLRAQLTDPPGHLEMLGIVARAAGFRNYQHLRAEIAATPAIDEKRVARAAATFGADGRWLRWPGKTSVQHLCLWVIWAQIPPRQGFTEREFSVWIDTLTAFRDPAQIRRSLVEARLVTRERDGSVYLRREQPVPADALALIRRVLSPPGRER